MGGEVSFGDLALAWERTRLGDRQALYKIDFDHERAKAAFKLLFPLRNEILSERAVLSKTADELGVPTEVLYELLNERASSLLASESSASESSGWSLEDALKIRTAITNDFIFLPLSKQMNEIEAKLFWATMMNENRPINAPSFLCCLGSKKNISPSVIRASEDFLSNEQIITAMYEDKDRLINPVYWYESPRGALRKRKYRPWSKFKTMGIDEYNGGVYQEIPHRGVCKLEYLEDKKLIVESAGDTITDVAFIDYPQLSLDERLVKFNNEWNHDCDVAFPKLISSWEAMIKADDSITIRFPNTGPFSPTERGGYVLVKDYHTHNLRLAAYEWDSNGILHLKAQALDGLVDFHDAAIFTVHILSDQNAVTFSLKRRLDVKKEREKGWTYLPDDECIVVKVSSPFMDRRTNLLSEPSFMSIEDDLGVSDVAQYVELWGDLDANGN